MEALARPPRGRQPPAVPAAVPLRPHRLGGCTETSADLSHPAPTLRRADFACVEVGHARLGKLNHLRQDRGSGKRRDVSSYQLAGGFDAARRFVGHRFIRRASSIFAGDCPGARAATLQQCAVNRAICQGQCASQYVPQNPAPSELCKVGCAQSRVSCDMNASDRAAAEPRRLMDRNAHRTLSRPEHSPRCWSATRRPSACRPRRAQVRQGAKERADRSSDSGHAIESNARDSFSRACDADSLSGAGHRAGQLRQESFAL